MLWLVLAWPHVVPPFGSMTTCASTLNSQGVNLPRAASCNQVTLSAWDESSWCLLKCSRRRAAPSQEIFPHAFQNHSLACVVLTFTVVAPDVVLTFT